MSNESEIEIKCVFGLLDPSNTREIHVQHINNLVHSLEKLSPTKNRSKTVEKVEETSIAKSKLKPVKEVEKRNSTFMITAQKTFPKRNSLKKAVNESSLNPESSDKQTKGLESKHAQDETPREGELLDKDKQEFNLKVFPNKKKNMDYHEFSDLYLDIFDNNTIKEDVLLRCFTLFDQEKQGYLNAKAVKKVFEVFNEKVTEEDIENLLKFVGCSGDRMTFHEFKEFFKKNL